MADDKAVQLLRHLVDIPSGSRNETGVRRVQIKIESELKALNFNVSIDEHSLLVAERKGSSNKFITLIVHADTVFEESSKFKTFELSPDGLTAKGPGVIDNKGGIVVAIEGLRKYLNGVKTPLSLRLVSSPSEELGSPRSQERFRELSKDSWLVLGFEPALDTGSIISSRRGNRWYHIKVQGREAHAGRAHREGVNACLELSEKLSKISAFTNYQKDVTVSIGHMNGGADKFNIVCGSAEAKVDARFADFKERDRLHNKILSVLKKSSVPGAETKFEIADDCPPFSENRNSKVYVQQYLKAILDAEGRSVHAEKSGGAADSNYFSHPDALVLDGLGPVGGKMHTEEEFIVLSTLKTRGMALAKFLEKLKEPQ